MIVPPKCLVSADIYIEAWNAFLGFNVSIKVVKFELGLFVYLIFLF